LKIAKVGADLALGLRFSRLPGMIKFSVLRIVTGRTLNFTKFNVVAIRSRP